MIPRAPPLVHIVDDDELVRAKMSYLLSNNGYSTEIYSGGPEFFRDCNLERGCILLDMRMPEMSGYDVLEELARRGNAPPVVVLSADGNIPAVVRAMKLGAVDFIQKPASEKTLLEAIDRALASPGESGIWRNVTAAAIVQLNNLPPRQRQVLQGLLDGLSNKGIAHRLGLSSRTVEMHRSHMNYELGIRSLSEAVQFALNAELVPQLRCANA
jgi:two-component system response regulator FixJ